jgi:hypothetical protein
MIIHQPLFSRFGFGILNNASKKMLELMEIYFDVNNKSKSGKWIPLDKDTALPHSSSNSINSQPCTLSCQLISTSNDQIQSKLDSLGLTLPQPLKALPNVKTRLHGFVYGKTKRIFPVMDPRTQMARSQDLLVR